MRVTLGSLRVKGQDEQQFEISNLRQLLQVHSLAFCCDSSAWSIFPPYSLAHYRLPLSPLLVPFASCCDTKIPNAFLTCVLLTAPYFPLSSTPPAHLRSLLMVENAEAAPSNPLDLGSGSTSARVESNHLIQSRPCILLSIEGATQSHCPILFSSQTSSLSENSYLALTSTCSCGNVIKDRTLSALSVALSLKSSQSRH